MRCVPTRLCGDARARIEPRTQRHQLDAVEHLGAEIAGDDLGQRRVRTQRVQPGRGGAAVGHAHTRPAQRAPARHRETGLTEPEDENVFARKFAHRSFSVDSPNSTSMMVMIQKRTTTWVSFQPLSS